MGAAVGQDHVASVLVQGWIPLRILFGQKLSYHSSQSGRTAILAIFSLQVPITSQVHSWLVGSSAGSNRKAQGTIFQRSKAIGLRREVESALFDGIRRTDQNFRR